MKILSILLIFVSIKAFAQLPGEFTRSVYEEVKHPYPLFDSLGVVSKETYYYRVGDMQFEYYSLFEKPQRDSILVYSYNFDSVQNKVTTLSGVEYEEVFLTEYYLSRNSEIYKVKYSESPYTYNRLLSKNKRQEWYGLKTYTRDLNGVIKSSNHKFYRKSWKKRRKKGYKMDSSSYKENFYNSLGLIDSSFKIVLKDFSSDTTVIEKIRNEYSNAGQLIRQVKTYKSRDVHYPNQQNGLYWFLNIKRKKHKIKTYANWNYIQKREFEFHKNGRLKAIHTQVDSGEIYSKLYEYTDFDSLASISSVNNRDTMSEEKLEYDSLNRVIYHFTTSPSDHSYVKDPRITYKLMLGGKGDNTKKYTYHDNGSYLIVSETNRGYLGTITTTSYHNARGLLLKKCYEESNCSLYIYDKNDNLVSLESSNSSFTKFKYNIIGFLIEKKTTSYDDPEDSIIRTFYKFNN